MERSLSACAAQQVDAVDFAGLSPLRPNGTKRLQRAGGHNRAVRYASFAGLGVGAAPIGIH
jgi:hypothetical protein